MAGQRYVEKSDVEAVLLRPLTTLQAQFIDNLCDQASAKLRTAMPSIDARMALYPAAGGIDPDVVTGVLADVLARFINNPDGATSVSKQAGSVQQSRSYLTAQQRRAGSGGRSDSGRIVITDDDLAQLQPVTTFRAAGTIRTGLGAGSPWCG